MRQPQVALPPMDNFELGCIPWITVLNFELGCMSNASMAPSTITETSLLREAVQNEMKWKNYTLKNKSRYLENEVDRSVNKLSPYYDETLSPTDPKFLAGVRRWEKNMGFVTSIKWTSAIPISLFHTVCITAFAYIIFHNTYPTWQTTWFAILVGNLAGFGVTGGVHRFWTHRSYKAKLPLQIILLICYSIAGQNNVYNWVRDHRLHHKLSDTSADPHDARRGLFFSHVGWLMMKKHPHVLEEGAKIDMSDIANDPVLKFYNKYFNFFKLVFCIIFPTAICVVAWDESWMMAIYAHVLIRYVATLNVTWSVNSFAHLWGYKPYDPNIMPGENIGVSLLSMGEGWHNYHHTFPWDYKAAELPYFINVTTMLLDLFAKIGWAYDMKIASPSLIQAVVDKRNSKHAN